MARLKTARHAGQPGVALRSPARRACHAAARRAPPPLRCSGDARAASAAEGGDSALAQPLAAYATRPVYVLTEPITFDKLTALMARAPGAAAQAQPATRALTVQPAAPLCRRCLAFPGRA